MDQVNQAETSNQTVVDNQVDNMDQVDKKDTRSLTSFLMLAIAFGGIGVHNFYIGNIVKGILSVLFFWTLIPSLLANITCYRVSKMSLDEISCKYKNVILTDCDKSGRKTCGILGIIFTISYSLTLLTSSNDFYYIIINGEQITLFDLLKQIRVILLKL